MVTAKGKTREGKKSPKRNTFTHGSNNGGMVHSFYATENATVQR